MMINATDYLGNGFPPDEGAGLAKALLNARALVERAEIDLRRVPVEMLISPFFNAFLQTVWERDPALLPLARSLVFKVEFDFQQKNIHSWLTEFKPFRAKANAQSN